VRGPTEAGPRWQLTLDGAAVLLDPVPARARQAPDPAVVAAFWARVVPTPGCWYWIGGYSHDGYGALHDIGPDGPRTVSAHRFAAALARLLPELEHDYKAPDVVQHECNERICCRIGPRHIVVGSQAENVRYAVACGRHRGPRPGAVDARGPLGRARAIRAALLAHPGSPGGFWPGYDPAALHAATNPPTTQYALFDPHSLNAAAVAPPAPPVQHARPADELPPSSPAPVELRPGH